MTALGVYGLWTVLLGAATFLVYDRDKRRARRRGWRTPEQTLHLLSLLGGWAGAWLARRYLRHKNRKPRFRIVEWGIIGLHFVLAGWLVWRVVAGVGG